MPRTTDAYRLPIPEFVDPPAMDGTRVQAGSNTEQRPRSTTNTRLATNAAMPVTAT